MVNHFFDSETNLVSATAKYATVGHHLSNFLIVGHTVLPLDVYVL